MILLKIFTKNFTKGVDKTPFLCYNSIRKRKNPQEKREVLNMDERKWIHCATQTSQYSVEYYDEYYAEDDPKQIKRVWHDGYTEYYETEE